MNFDQNTRLGAGQKMGHQQLLPRVVVLLAYLGWLFAGATQAAETVLSEFNHSGFLYVFDQGVTQTISSDSVRLFDPDDGWVGGGVHVDATGSGYSDFSAFASGRVVLDLATAPAHGVDHIGLELIDADNNSGTWAFNLSEIPSNTATQLVSKTKLNQPTYGNSGVANLDLSRIKTWQILGDYDLMAPNPADPVSFDVSFDRVALSTDAPAYPGAEPNAPWRAEAATRIDANRKADIQLTVRDGAGNALVGAEAAIRMKGHEFGFGSAAVAFRLRDETDPNYDPANAVYKQKVRELFNVATVENALKWWPWEADAGDHSNQTGIDAVDWLRGEGLRVRGHAMVWPAYENLPPSMRAMLDASETWDATQQQAARNAVLAHIAEIGGTFSGKLSAWDVVNEPRTNRDLFDRLSEGEQVMEQWFQAAQTADGTTPLYLNEYSILAAGGLVGTDAQQQLFDRATSLKAANVGLAGLGMQAHFDEASLAGPAQLWEVADRFASLGLDLQVTEFDFQTDDEQLQADYLRDFYTAMFAHEAIDEILMWGFWEGAHWRPSAALFREDWTLKPNGQAYLDLVLDEWWTDETLAASADGKIELRGFKGDYEIVVTHGGISKMVEAQLSDDGLTLEIVLQPLAADFNTDGAVDASDLALWQQEFSTTYTPADLLRWQQQFGQSLASVASQAVPEPSGLAMLCVLAVGLLGYCRLY